MKIDVVAITSKKREPLQPRPKGQEEREIIGAQRGYLIERNC